MSQKLMTRMRSTIFYLLLADLVVFYIFHLMVNGSMIFLLSAFCFFTPLILYFLPITGLIITNNKIDWPSGLCFYLLSILMMGIFIKFDFPWPLERMAGGNTEPLPMYIGVVI